MKPYFIALLLVPLLLSGCLATSDRINELSERQDALEARMDKLIEDLDSYNSKNERNIERIEKNQLLLAQEVETMQKKSITLDKKIEDVTNKNGEGNKGAPSANKIYAKADNSYKSRKYEDAILEFQQLIDTYPNDWRVPNAYLKQGNALINLDRKKEAAFFFKTLIDKYPNSPEANIAKQKLKAI